MDVETVSVEELTPDPENTRLHPEENLEAIQASLARFGQVLPLVVHAETGIVIGGNGTLAAMKRLKLQHAKIVRHQGSKQEARALGIALNRSAELAQWDPLALGRMLEGLAGDFAFREVGFSDKAAQQLIESTRDMAFLGEESSEYVPPEEKDEAEGPGWEDPSEHVTLSFVVTPEQQAWVLAALKREKTKGTKGAKLASVCKLYVEAMSDG